MQLGGVAVLVRQTNIIWMLFVACTGVLDLIQAKQKREESFSSEPKDDYFASSRGFNINSNLKKRRSGIAIAAAISSVHGTDLSYLPDRPSGLLHLISTSTYCGMLCKNQICIGDNFDLFTYV